MIEYSGTPFVVAAHTPSRRPSPCASIFHPIFIAIARSCRRGPCEDACWCDGFRFRGAVNNFRGEQQCKIIRLIRTGNARRQSAMAAFVPRSEEHTSELQSLRHLVCRL